MHSTVAERDFAFLRALKTTSSWTRLLVHTRIPKLCLDFWHGVRFGEGGTADHVLKFRSRPFPLLVAHVF